LKDWLLASGVDKTKLDNYIESTIELKVCQKFTNSIKHMSKTDPNSPQLADWVSIEASSPMAREYNYFAMNEEERESWGIPVGIGDEKNVGKDIPIGDFMRHCMEQWNEFLSSQNLDRLRSV
jgi:hypothetical protein